MKISIEKEIITTQIDNETAIFNIQTGKYYCLKGSGVRMWELLQKYEETEAVFNIVANEYNVDPNILRIDLNKLIKNLENAYLVTIL